MEGAGRRLRGCGRRAPTTRAADPTPAALEAPIAGMKSAPSGAVAAVTDAARRCGRRTATCRSAPPGRVRRTPPREAGRACPHGNVPRDFQRDRAPERGATHVEPLRPVRDRPRHPPPVARERLPGPWLEPRWNFQVGNCFPLRGEQPIVGPETREEDQAGRAGTCWAGGVGHRLIERRPFSTCRRRRP